MCRKPWICISWQWDDSSHNAVKIFQPHRRCGSMYDNSVCGWTTTVVQTTTSQQKTGHVTFKFDIDSCYPHRKLTLMVDFSDSLIFLQGWHLRFLSETSPGLLDRLSGAWLTHSWCLFYELKSFWWLCDFSTGPSFRSEFQFVSTWVYDPKPVQLMTSASAALCVYS